MSSDVAVQQLYPLIAQTMERLSLETGIQEDVNPALGFMEQILRAETEEEVFAQQETGSISGQDYVGRVFYLNKNGITWKRTAQVFREQGAFPFYALLRVTLDDGTDGTITCGASSVVAVLDRLVQLGALDNDKGMMFVEKPTASGNTILLLRPVPATGKKPGKK